MSRQQVQHFSYNMSAGTLAQGAAVTANGNIDANREQGVRIKQFKAVCSITNYPNAEGPIIVGFVLGPSNTELSEAIVADPQNIHDVPAVEQANRKVFPIWSFGPESDNNNAQGPIGARGGQNVYEEVNFPWKEIPEGVGLNSFVFNEGSAGGALSGDVNVFIQTVMVLEWLRD